MFEDVLAPVSSSLLDEVRDSEFDHLGKWIHVHDEIEGMPEWTDAQLCIVGICEDRGKVGDAPQALSADKVRKELYKLFPGDWNFKLVDIGNIYSGESLEDSYVAVKEVVGEILKEGVIPIVLGGSQDLTYPMYRGYAFNEQTVNIISVDSRFDLGRQTEGAINEHNYLSHVILKKPYRLFNFSNIGYQNYYVNQEERELMEKMHFDLLRVGEIRSDLSLCEPLFRDADLVSFDVSSLKAGGLNGIAHPGPNGFTEEEICALSRYAGISDKVSSMGLFGMTYQESDSNSVFYQLMSQIIWYFLEGFSGRKGDYPASSTKNYSRFSVLLNNGEQELIFYKSPLSGRWWMEVPVVTPTSGTKPRLMLIPCTQQDYDQACSNEVPERWWRAYQKGM